MVYLKYDSQTGTFIPDDNYKRHGKQAVTIYTGSVIVLDDFTFDCKNRKWLGKQADGNILKINPSAIIEMKGVA